MDKKGCQLINDIIPKEIKKINKLLKKDQFDPIVVGFEALDKCFLPSKDALQLALWQEFSGLHFIFNANQLPTLWGSPDSTEFALATIGSSHIPDYARLDASDTKNEVKKKFDLITNTIRWFTFNQEKAAKTPEKLRTLVDNVLLSVKMDDVFYESGRVKKHNLSPYELYHISISNYWSKINHQGKNPLLSGYDHTLKQKTFFKPWLIITKSKKGYVFIHGRNQQQLIKFLLHSDYMNDNLIEFHFDTDFYLGWDKVLEKQLTLGQQISKETIELFNDYQEQPKIPSKRKFSHFFISKNKNADDDFLEQSQSN